jgi:hypothetical protein
MHMDERNTNRRRSFLKYAGVAAVSGLAGCAGGDGETTPTATDSPTETATASPTETASATPTSGGGEATHEVPHPNDGAVPEAERNAEALNGLQRPDDPAENKSGIGFQHEPEGEQYCGNCSQYVPDRTGDGFGACYLVDGKIHPCDYCILWVEYDGDDPVPCESG